jgi:hypothetical protein
MVSLPEIRIHLAYQATALMRLKVPLFYLSKIPVITVLLMIWHFICGNDAYGQNFIPNGDFEQFDTCPNKLGQLKLAEPWFNATYPESEYFNTCSINDTSICYQPIILAFSRLNPEAVIVVCM